MSNRPKNIQYGTAAAGAPGKEFKGGGDDNPMAAKIAIGAVLAVVLITLAVFAFKDGGGDLGNQVAFQNATIEGADLAVMSEDPVDAAVGETIPTVVGKSFDGTEMTIKPGKPQIIALMAHWCAHCQAEVPRIVEWQSGKDFPKDLQIVAVTTSADEAKGNFPPASWLERENWTNDTLVDTPDGKIMKAFGGTGFPTLVAVTADGKVARRTSGEQTVEQLRELADAALGKASPDTTTPVDNGESSPVPETTVVPQG